MRRSLLIAALMASLAVPLSTWSATKTIVAVADPYPPYLDPQDPTGGIAVEIIRAAYKTQGYALQLEIMPWARAEKGVKEGRYDVLLNVWRTQARAQELLFSTPYAVSKIKFIKLKGDPFEYTGLDSLKGKRIGTVRGYGYGDAFSRSTLFSKDEVNEVSLNLKKLILKRIDLTLEDEITAKFLLKRNEPELAGQLEFTIQSLSDNPLYIASGLKNPNHTEWIEAFNKGYQRIQNNGTLAEIQKRYGLGK